MARKDILAVVLVAFAVIVSGCLDNGDDQEVDLPEHDVRVDVGEMYFQQPDMPQDELEAEVGDTIVFYNEGSTAHTVTIDHLDVDEQIGTGEVVVVEADEAGEDVFVDCTYHGSHDAVLDIVET